MEESIKECDTEIYDIATSLEFKPYHIKNVNDHIFYKEHKIN